MAYESVTQAPEILISETARFSRAASEHVILPIEKDPISMSLSDSRSVNEDELTPDELEQFDEDEDARVEHPEHKPDFPPLKKGLFYAGIVCLIGIPGLLALSPFPLLPMMAIPVLGPIFAGIIELPAFVLLTLSVGPEHAKWTIKSFYRKAKIKTRHFFVGLFESEKPVEVVEDFAKKVGKFIKNLFSKKKLRN